MLILVNYNSYKLDFLHYYTVKYLSSKHYSKNHQYG